MESRITAVLTAVFFMFLGAQVNAAEIFIGTIGLSGISAIRIDGQIVRGDEQKFVAVAATRKTSFVYLSSPGGDVDVAVAIGRAIRESQA